MDSNVVNAMAGVKVWEKKKKKENGIAAILGKVPEMLPPRCVHASVVGVHGAPAIFMRLLCFT